MLCDFGGGFRSPEMTKRRPVIGLSKKRHDGAPLCTVVAISTTRPDVVRDFHYLIPEEELPPFLRIARGEHWVKIDMVNTVSFSRLTLPHEGRDNRGNRRFITRQIGDAHKAEISGRLQTRLALTKLDV